MTAITSAQAGHATFVAATPPRQHGRGAHQEEQQQEHRSDRLLEVRLAHADLLAAHGLDHEREDRPEQDDRGRREQQHVVADDRGLTRHHRVESSGRAERGQPPGHQTEPSEEDQHEERQVCRPDG
jgi:hypothetical protein